MRLSSGIAIIRGRYSDLFLDSTRGCAVGKLAVRGKESGNGCSPALTNPYAVVVRVSREQVLRPRLRLKFISEGTPIFNESGRPVLIPNLNDVKCLWDKIRRDRVFLVPVHEKTAQAGQAHAAWKMLKNE